MAVKNMYKVHAEQWKLWSDASKVIFNRLYEEMKGNLKLFQHPDASLPSRKQWETTCWNAAWRAACISEEENEV